MAVKDLHEFLVALSKHRSLREAYVKNPTSVGADAGLDATEIALLNSNDEKRIRAYLGEKYAAAALIQVKP